MTRRQLVLIRHAKAAVGSVDIDRPLTPRGKRDAVAVGRWLAREGIAPDRVVTSPALRARQTWEGAQAQLPEPADVDVDERVYDNDVAALFEVIADTPESVHTLAPVGHNPSFAELAAALDDGQGDREARKQLHAGYPTAAVAVYELAGPWAEVQPGTATLKRFAVPRGTS